MPRARKIKRNEMLVACYRQGLSLREVAQVFDLKPASVHVIIKRDAPEILRTENWNGRRKRLAPSAANICQSNSMPS
jgi:DNA-directed RNA polymerase specialized sigma24 family protein